MSQQLIVEGNDAVVLAQICKQNGLNPPLGYHTPHKFKNEFVKKANGVSKVNRRLIEALENPDLTNIGIIVDANDKGAAARFLALKQTIEEQLDIKIPTENKLTNEGFTMTIDESLTVGIWVMPDNVSNGYLEHFLGKLIPKNNLILQFATDKTTELMEADFCKFGATKKQKAILHSYLAWQENPGLPFGTAVNAKYFDSKANAVSSFLKWFERTFVLV